MDITVQFDGIDFADKDEFLDGGVWDNYQTKIAGINFHITPNETGKYAVATGYCRYNDDKTEFPEAVRIEASSHRLLGFIPKDELKEYKSWAKGKVLPCVIGVKPFVTNEGKLKIVGFCTVIKARDEDELKNQIEHYANKSLSLYQEQVKDLGQKLYISKPAKRKNTGCSANVIIFLVVLATLLQVLCK